MFGPGGAEAGEELSAEIVQIDEGDASLCGELPRCIGMDLERGHEFVFAKDAELHRCHENGNRILGAGGFDDVLEIRLVLLGADRAKGIVVAKLDEHHRRFLREHRLPTAFGEEAR